MQIQEELSKMMNDISGDLINLEQGVVSQYIVEDYIEKDLPYNDSLCFNFGWIFHDEYVYPIYTGYQAAQENGIDIIRNDSIREFLQSSFDYNFPRIINNMLSP